MTAGDHELINNLTADKPIKVKKLVISFLRWFGWIFLVAVILFLGVITYLLVREWAARSKYQTAYLPPGEMVNLNTHAIHLNCVGAGTPTVVFEADIDQLGSLSWDRVQSEVGKFTRACSYDRAGIMWSEQGSRPRDGVRIARELEAVLDEAGEAGITPPAW